MTADHAGARYDRMTGPAGAPAHRPGAAERTMHPWFAERRAELDRAASRELPPRDTGGFDHFHHFQNLPRTGGRRGRHAAEQAEYAAYAGAGFETRADTEYPAGADAEAEDPIGWDPSGPDVPGWYTAVPAALPDAPPDPRPYAAPEAVAALPGPAHAGFADTPPARFPDVDVPTVPDLRAVGVPVRPPVPGPPPGPAAETRTTQRSARRGAHRLLSRAGGRRPRSSAELAALLTTDALVRPQPSRPESGWRRALWELSGGRMNPGVGGAAQDRAELVDRIRAPLHGSHRIAVVSVKGGVGKTTVSAGLGLTFAELRADRVLVMDTNPDMGTLADRLTGDSAVTVQHLLDHLGAVDVTSVSEIEQFVSSIGRLDVLAGGQEPCDGLAFTLDEYEEAVAALSECYNLLITDSGTGVNHSAMEATIAAADGVVIVGAPTVDAATRASMTLEWLEDIGRGELAHNAVVVLSLDRTSRDVDRRTVVDHFVPRCRAVVEIPADPHLATGGRIELAACRQVTRDAFLVLAAELADAFPGQEW